MVNRSRAELEWALEILAEIIHAQANWLTSLANDGYLSIISLIMFQILRPLSS